MFPAITMEHREDRMDTTTLERPADGAAPTLRDLTAEADERQRFLDFLGGTED